jgi:hypothetical protein
MFFCTIRPGDLPLVAVVSSQCSFPLQPGHKPQRPSPQAHPLQALQARRPPPHRLVFRRPHHPRRRPLKKSRPKPRRKAPPARPAPSPRSPPSTSPCARPQRVKELLDKHLELQRYRAVTDLDEAELARLIVLAERNVRNLVGTLGYFSPTIAITREGGPNQRPTIVVAVEPGQPTTVGTVAIDFAGDIAESPDPAAQAQRADIQRDWRLPAGQALHAGRLGRRQDPGPARPGGAPLPGRQAGRQPGRRRRAGTQRGPQPQARLRPALPPGPHAGHRRGTLRPGAGAAPGAPDHRRAVRPEPAGRGAAAPGLQRLLRFGLCLCRPRQRPRGRARAGAGARGQAAENRAWRRRHHRQPARAPPSSTRTCACPAPTGAPPPSCRSKPKRPSRRPNGRPFPTRPTGAGWRWRAPSASTTANSSPAPSACASAAPRPANA